MPRNQIRTWVDLIGMECAKCRELMSARQDGESVDVASIDSHLEGCAECRDWLERSHRLARTRLGLVDRDQAAVKLGDRPPGFVLNRWLRIMLGWVGAILVVWNSAGVFEAADTGAVHLARHQSAFAVALGVAFLYVAWRPERAYGLVPFSVTFALAVALVAVMDLVTQSTEVSRESLHFLELAGLVILWTLGVRVGPGRVKSGAQ